MKKILCLVLTLAMVMSFIPAALAVPAEKTLDTETVAQNLEAPTFESSAVLNVPELENLQTNGTSSGSHKEAIPEEYRSFDMLRPTTRWETLTPWGLPFIPAEESSNNGYVFAPNNAQTALEWVDEGLEGGKTGWATWVVPSSDGGDAGNIRKKGESVYVRVGLFKNYDAFSQTLTSFEAGVEITVEARVFLGYAGSSNVEWYDRIMGTNGVNVDVTVPDDDMMVYIFLVAYFNTKSDCVFFVTPGMFDARWSTMNKSKAETLPADKMVQIDLNSRTDTVDMLNTNFYMSRAKMFKFEAEGGTLYNAVVDGEGQGVQYTIMDEDMQIVSNIYASIYAIDESRGSYDKFISPFWAPHDGTYYIVVNGFWYDDDGVVDFGMMQIDEKDNPIGKNKVTINLSDLGKSNKTESAYEYRWDAQYNYGTLYISDYSGTEYTLTGSNENVLVFVNHWHTVNLDNCSFNSLALGNQFGPVLFNVKGTVTLEGNMGDKIFNWGMSQPSLYYGNSAFFEGDTLHLRGEEGIMLQNYTVHLYVKTLDIKANPAPNSYPINIWSYGHEAKPFKLGKNYKFNDDKYQITTGLFASKQDLGGFDGALFCYTISDYDVLYYYLSTPDLRYAPDSVIVTSEGSPNGTTPDSKKGDVNDNGMVDTGDATMILRDVVGMTKIPDDRRARADMNDNGNIDTGDATMVLRIVVGL